MKCPNCGHENAEGAAECLNCQIIFAKWTGRSAAQPPRDAAPAEQAGGAPAGTSLLPKIFIALAIAAVPAWFFLKPAAGPVARSGEPPAAAQPAAAEPQAPRPAAPAPAGNLWKFEGTVLDLLRETPVEGATLKFYNDANGETFQAATDFSGRYSLELKPREKGGYGVHISHPGYGNQHWDAKYAQINKAERYRMGGRVQFGSYEELMCHTGGAGAVIIYDFAIFPDKLTEEERAESYKAVSGGTAGD